MFAGRTQPRDGNGVGNGVVVTATVQSGIPLWAFIFTSVSCILLLVVVAVLGWKLTARPYPSPTTKYGNMPHMQQFRPRNRRLDSHDSNISSSNDSVFEDREKEGPPAPELAATRDISGRSIVHSTFRKGHVREPSDYTGPAFPQDGLV